VTASVQGHNINVFKIMPMRENSSASDAGPSHVHLYRLQRGFTNAVSQIHSHLSYDLMHIHFLFAMCPQAAETFIYLYSTFSGYTRYKF
jgi:hypothetical protein